MGADDLSDVELDGTEGYQQKSNDVTPARGRDACLRAALIGAVVGSLLLIPAYLALFVMGREPNGDGPWG
jgi:hypothetical protein